MADLPFEAPKILSIYLQIANYPILAQQIRSRMREDLFRRGIITPQALEDEVRQKSLLSQRREGLGETPEEAPHLWEQRQQIVRDYLTDFYFAYNLSIEQFQHIVESLLAERDVHHNEMGLRFNPELAPFDLLLKQAKQYESLSGEPRAQVSHHLEEILVVLIKTIISDHLEFVRIAKECFTADDLYFVRSRRIGTGKIGGKSAGMLLAWKILQQAAPALAERVNVPESYFIGTDVFYDFLSLNGLEYFNQKYKPLDEIRADYPKVVEDYVQGHLPKDITDQLRAVLDKIGKHPIVARSSSLLEDNFGTSFAGKYESHFCSNQGTLEENLQDLTLAIRRIYASAFNPDAMLYRRHMGLLDYDERMAILLQEVQGQAHGRYFFPTLAGVAFGRVPILWHSRLRREDGFMRMVLGLGTRAVGRVADDYPRLVTLSHPTLRPETSTAAVRRYSQRFVDVIDLEDKAFKTLPVEQVVNSGFAPLRWLASIEEDGTLMPMISPLQVASNQWVLTFDAVLGRSDLVPMMKDTLSILNQQYGCPVDIEFAFTLTPGSARPHLQFHLLQCRPQSSLVGKLTRSIPADLPTEDTLFKVTRMVPQGEVDRVEYLIYVDPDHYGQLENPAWRQDVAYVVSHLNKLLEGRAFILLGPGRWGSVNPDLGVPVTYADIYNSRAMVEIAVPQSGVLPEPSYGTHFFQDLVEAEIYPLAIYPGEPGDFLNQAMLDAALNCLTDYQPAAARLAGCIKLVHIPTLRPGCHLEIVLDGEQGLAFLAQDQGVEGDG